MKNLSCVKLCGFASKSKKPISSHHGIFHQFFGNRTAKLRWIGHQPLHLTHISGSMEVNVDIPRTSHVWHLIPILDFPLIMFGYVWSIVSDSHWQRSEFTSAPTWKHSWEHSDANTHILQALWAFWSSLKQTAKHDANTEVVSINTSPESVY